MHFIYKITNNINNKIYIGQTNNPSSRWSRHKYNARNNKCSQLITKAMIKHGVGNFSFEVIATCKNQFDADKTEEEIIFQSNSRDPEIGYNVAIGGNSSPRTPEILKKISDKLKEHYKTHDSHMKGKKLSDEWKQNMSKSAIGKAGTNKGKTFSKKHKLKLSKSQVGRQRFSTRKFDSETEKEICRLYVEESESAYSIAKRFNCYRSLVLTILKRNKIKQRQSNYIGHKNVANKFTEEQELQICKIYQEGQHSISDLSKKFSCGKTTIRDILLRHDSLLIGEN